MGRVLEATQFSMVEFDRYESQGGSGGVSITDAKRTGMEMLKHEIINQKSGLNLGGGRNNVSRVRVMKDTDTDKTSLIYVFKKDPEQIRREKEAAERAAKPPPPPAPVKMFIPDIRKLVVKILVAIETASVDPELNSPFWGNFRLVITQFIETASRITDFKNHGSLVVLLNAVSGLSLDLAKTQGEIMMRAVEENNAEHPILVINHDLIFLEALLKVQVSLPMFQDKPYKQNRPNKKKHHNGANGHKPQVAYKGQQTQGT